MKDASSPARTTSATLDMMIWVTWNVHVYGNHLVDIYRPIYFTQELYLLENKGITCLTGNVCLKLRARFLLYFLLVARYPQAPRVREFNEDQTHL